MAADMRSGGGAADCTCSGQPLRCEQVCARYHMRFKCHPALVRITLGAISAPCQGNSVCTVPHVPLRPWPHV